MAFTITDALNSWNDIGVFSYVIPFLLIFAIVYAILDKTKLLSGSGNNENKGIITIIAVAVALLSIQMDIVATFFATIFPRFGVGISIFLCFVIFVGFFMPAPETGKGLKYGWVGWVIGVGVIVWSISSWGQWNINGGVGAWIAEYIWSLIVLGIIVAIVFFATKKPTNDSVSKP